ncbi:hypothetical protein NDN11_03620 [Acinetobacter sp. C26M]|uniref:hypothetical protein n=1 Tax=unclassified Acinetobacter TaxID=196816 RepID=UPI00203701F2|nr:MULTISPECIES: hypothetical protein [unclassified Acinetobacter]USA47224.1 hypothetical protein NDN11_03620 [Acinetobacter sp. C26M]USA50705.1 hypothetical protein NDN12_03620 [Acinetobacter sp. C26G]
MSDHDKEQEKIEIAKIAATAAELAASNIRNYIEAHKEFALGPVNPVNRVMKIADDLNKEMRDLVESSARLAYKSLKQFTDDQE